MPTPSRAARPPSSRPARPAAALAAVAVLAGAGLVAADQAGRRPAIVTAEVPSYWEEASMSCETTQIDLSERDLELFRCDFIGAGRARPGRYDATDTVWYSDVDGRRARDHEIVITPSGSVSGWAAY